MPLLNLSWCLVCGKEQHGADRPKAHLHSGWHSSILVSKFQSLIEQLLPIGKTAYGLFTKATMTTLNLCSDLTLNMVVSLCYKDPSDLDFWGFLRIWAMTATWFSAKTSSWLISPPPIPSSHMSTDILVNMNPSFGSPLPSGYPWDVFFGPPSYQKAADIVGDHRLGKILPRKFSFF